jgi:hypothetical protein
MLSTFLEKDSKHDHERNKKTRKWNGGEESELGRSYRLGQLQIMHVYHS